MKKEYEIWIEGYAATGESGSAHFIGKSFGKDFRDACIGFTYPEDIIREWDGAILKKKGDPLPLDTDRKGNIELSIWACRLFDNEAEARKSFG